MNDCTGFGDEVNGNETLNVYPNPSNGHFYINATSQIINSIQVFDITGACVYTSNKSLNTIDLSLQKNGIYFLKILTNKQSQIIKIIKE